MRTCRHCNKEVEENGYDNMYANNIFMSERYPLHFDCIESYILALEDEIEDLHRELAGECI